MCVYWGNSETVSFRPLRRLGSPENVTLRSFDDLRLELGKDDILSFWDGLEVIVVSFEGLLPRRGLRDGSGVSEVGEVTLVLGASGILLYTTDSSENCESFGVAATTDTWPGLLNLGTDDSMEEAEYAILD